MSNECNMSNKGNRGNMPSLLMLPLLSMLPMLLMLHLLLNNTPTTWCFLIKAPHPGKFSVMCDAENNLSSDEKQNCNSS